MAYNISDEERKARSDRAREQFKKGNFGGPQPGSGRPRTKKLANEVVAEKIANHADKIWQALEASLNEKEPASVRLAGAKEALKIERDVEELRIKERAYDQMTAKELQDGLVDRLLRVAASGAIPLSAFGIGVMELESVEEPDEEHVDS